MYLFYLKWYISVKHDFSSQDVHLLKKSTKCLKIKGLKKSVVLDRSRGYAANKFRY